MNWLSLHVQAGLGADGVVVVGSVQWVTPTLSLPSDPEASLLI